jgi:hypothetical protein
VRVRHAFLLAPTLAASCNSAPEDARKNEVGVSRELAAAFSPASPQPLQLTLVTEPLANGLRVEGRANLPDGTELMIRIQRGPVVVETRSM